MPNLACPESLRGDTVYIFSINSSIIVISITPQTPPQRQQRRHNIALTPHSPVADASYEVYPSSDGDSLNGDHEPKSIGHTADGPQGEEIEIPVPQGEEMETPVPQSWVLVEGVPMLIPKTYDPDTYDPDAPLPGTPEPVSSSPQTYAAWGQKHFGEEWHNSRKTMLEERNIYLRYDKVYAERQIALRIIEHKIERRPFEPAKRAGGILDADWKRWWARLSKQLKIPSGPPSPLPKMGDIPVDPREKLEFKRKYLGWDQERYHFEKMFLKEILKDRARSLREDADGDKQASERREAMESCRHSDPSRYAIENNRSQAHVGRRKKGWTAEEIDAEFDADIALHEWGPKNPEPEGSGIYGTTATPEDRAASYIWEQNLNALKIRLYGELPPMGSGLGGFPVTEEERDAFDVWRKNIHARVSRRQQQGGLASASSDASATKKASNIRVSPPRRPTDILRRTRGSRITKNAATHAEASPFYRRRQPSEPDTLEELGNNTQTTSQHRPARRKTYKKERASRRLAGELPEHGMLLGRGEVQPLYWASSQQPPNTHAAASSRASQSQRRARRARRARNHKGFRNPGKLRQAAQRG